MTVLKNEPAPPTEAPINYTEEQAHIAKEIINTKDYYELLGVGKDFTENDLKKAFRKKALKVHPYKNSAPDA